MRGARPGSTLLTLLLLLAAVMPLRASDGPEPVRFLTGPHPGSALEIALGYLDQQLQTLGLSATDLAEIEVQSHYQTQHNGVTHVYLQQRYQGLEVFGGVINVNVGADGSVLSLGQRFVIDLAGSTNTLSPILDDRAAIERAAEHLGLARTGELILLASESGLARRAVYSGVDLSHDDIPVRLMIQPTAGGARLVWQTVLRLVDSPDWWSLRVDAVTGEVLSKNNWTSYDAYLVYALPFENPVDAGDVQTLVEDPAEATASPFAWHDIDGMAGREFTDTRGNNVFAQTDPAGDNTGDFRPDGDMGGPMLEFTYLHDPALEPDEGTNTEAAVTNLFYFANVMHDVTYGYGFDEAAGNFQENNYGRGGVGGDPVFADAQDGGCVNCSMFGTPPDGASGRLTLSTWVPLINRVVRVLTPPSIVGDVAASSASFGTQPDEIGITGTVELVDDGDDSGGAGTVDDGCEPLIDFTAGNIALIERGFCEFGQKVLSAETAGALAAIVINDSQELLHMAAGSVGDQVTIPSVLITRTDGDTLIGELASGISATVLDSEVPDRDSAFDNGLIAHEYGHGISQRLTGGPLNVSCLTGSEQAGEGWSDFWTLVLTAKPTDAPTLPRTIGTYAAAGGGSGIRNFPYTTDLGVNPQTYMDISATNVPHGVGEVWMGMLWEVYWELVARHGFDPDIYHGTGGNNLTIQLVVDGMKLQPCNPTFVDARDAILLADQVASGGVNQCEIWRGFAKRGLGTGAIGGSINVGDETEDFTVPAGCDGTIFADGFESGDTSAWN